MELGSMAARAMVDAAAPAPRRARWRIVLTDPAWFFVAVSLLFGTAMAIAVPIGNTPDEAAHVARAYEVAHLHLIAPKEGTSVGVTMPVTLMDPSPQSADGKDLRGDVTAMLTLREAARSYIKPPLTKDEVAFRPTFPTATYSPVAYIPQAVAIAIGETVNMPPGSIYLLVRLFTLAVRTALGFVAIRWWRQKPWALTAIMLLPMMVSQSIAPGADAMTFSLGALIVAATLRLRLDPTGAALEATAAPGAGRRTLTAWGVADLTALGAAATLTKPAVMTLFPVVFALIPTSAIRVRFPRLAKVAMIAVPVVISVAWLAVTEVYLGNDGVSEAHDGRSQLQHLFAHPVTFVTVFVRTWFGGFTNDGIRGIAGLFGYLEVGLPLWLDVVVFIALAGYLWCYRRRAPELPGRVRVFFAVWVVAFVYATYMALYIGWTPPGQAFIEGVQGRYLLPALFLALPVAPNIAKITRRAETILVKAVPVALLTISLLYIVTRYYHTYLAEFSSIG
jgi:uncharacterized membrane protein